MWGMEKAEPWFAPLTELCCEDRDLRTFVQRCDAEPITLYILTGQGREGSHVPTGQDQVLLAWKWIWGGPWLPSLAGMERCKKVGSMQPHVSEGRQTCSPRGLSGLSGIWPGENLSCSKAGI